MCNVQRKGQGNTFLCDCRTRLECPGGCGTWSKKVCVADRAIGGTGCPIWYHWIRRSYKQYPTLGQAASFNSIQFIWSWEDLQPFGVEDRYQSNSIYICNIYIYITSYYPFKPTVRRLQNSGEAALSTTCRGTQVEGGPCVAAVQSAATSMP